MDYHRRSIRLDGYDYSQKGWYFVTICTHDRNCIFGSIVGATRGSPSVMKLNSYGKIVESIWKSVPNHHSVILDSFQIMPNHIHFILGLVGISEGASRRAPTIHAPTIGMIVGFLKSESTKQINRVGATRGSPLIVWQRNYWEHIIRDESEHFRIKEYIKDNPVNWEKDKLFK